MLRCPVTAPSWVANENTVEGPDTVVAWPIAPCCDAIDLLLPENVRFIAAAVDAMHTKTCGKYGVCSVTYRPCVSRCDCRDVCSGDCSWRAYDLRDLTMLPIISVDEIRIDGDVVAETQYWLSANSLIPLRDGVLWSRYVPQDMNLPFNSSGTWSVTLTVGEIPPELVLIAAGDLACHLARLCLGLPCDLPQNAVSVTRDGVTVRLDTGFEAIQTVKMAIDAYGCNARARRSRIVDPSEFTVATRS